jgi:RNA polymerase sigma-70 factor, ECF subfamily
MAQGMRGQGAQGDAATAEATVVDIVGAHRTILMAKVMRLTGGDQAWAEDVVQETFVRAWRHADRLTPALGSVRGWLMRVAHNLVMDDYRAARVRPAQVRIDPAEAEIDGLVRLPLADRNEHVLTTRVLEDALRTLRPEHREALVELYLNDRTAVEAAGVLGIPVGTVKSRCFYALRHLRSVLDRTVLAS